MDGPGPHVDPWSAEVRSEAKPLPPLPSGRNLRVLIPPDGGRTGRKLETLPGAVRTPPAAPHKTSVVAPDASVARAGGRSVLGQSEVDLESVHSSGGPSSADGSGGTRRGSGDTARSATDAAPHASAHSSVPVSTQYHSRHSTRKGSKRTTRSKSGRRTRSSRMLGDTGLHSSRSSVSDGVVELLRQLRQYSQWFVPIVVAAVGVWATLLIRDQAQELTRDTALFGAQDAWRQRVQSALGENVRQPLLAAMEDVLAIRHHVSAMPEALTNRTDLPVMPALDVAMRYGDSAGGRPAGLFAVGFVRFLHADEMDAAEAQLEAYYGRDITLRRPQNNSKIKDFAGTLTHARPPEMSTFFIGFDYMVYPGVSDSILTLAGSGGPASTYMLRIIIPEIKGVPIIAKFEAAVVLLVPIYRPTMARVDAFANPSVVDPSAFLRPPKEDRLPTLLGASFTAVNVDDLFEDTLRELIALASTIVVEDVTPPSGFDDVIATRNAAGAWMQWDAPPLVPEEKALMGCGTGAELVWAHDPANTRAPQGSKLTPAEVQAACAFIVASPPAQHMRRTLDMGGRLWVFHVGAAANVTHAAVAAAAAADSQPQFVLVVGLITTAILVMAVGAVMYAALMRTHRVRARGAVRAAEAAKNAHEETMSYACHELRNPLHAVSATADFLARDLDELSRTLRKAAAAQKHGRAPPPWAPLQSPASGDEYDFSRGASPLPPAGAAATSGPAGSADGAGAVAGAGASLVSGSLAGLMPAGSDVAEAVESLRGDARTIIRSSKLMQAVVDDLLDYAKLRRGQLEIVPSPIVVRDLLDELVSSHRAFANVDLEGEVAPNVPSTLYADELRLRQVISNGLSNACKLVSRGRIRVVFSVARDIDGTRRVLPAGSRSVMDGSDDSDPQEGTAATDTRASSPEVGRTPKSARSAGGDRVTVRVPPHTVVGDGRGTRAQGRSRLARNGKKPGFFKSVSRDTSARSMERSFGRGDDQYLLVEILDTGPGLRGSDAVALFQPFEQGALARRARRANKDARVDRSKAGTGLGLAICYQLAHIMGGHIGLEDRHDEPPSSEADDARAGVRKGAGRRPGSAEKAARRRAQRDGRERRTSIVGALVRRISGGDALETERPRRTDRDVIGARFWFTVPLLSATASNMGDSSDGSVPSATQSGKYESKPAAGSGSGRAAAEFRAGGSVGAASGAGPPPGVAALVVAPNKSGASEVLAMDFRGTGVPSPSMMARRGSAQDDAAATARAVVAGTHWLVVDDESINRRLTARFLHVLGCTCDLLEDGDMLEPFLRENHAWALKPAGTAAGSGAGSGVWSDGVTPHSAGSGRPTPSASVGKDTDAKGGDAGGTDGGTPASPTKWAVREASATTPTSKGGSRGGAGMVTRSSTMASATDLSGARVLSYDGRPLPAGAKPLAGILLDIEMKRSRGDQVCAHLRSLGLRLPVIACTGNASTHDKALFEAMGMTSVLTKPFNRGTLGDALVQGLAIAQLAERGR